MNELGQKIKSAVITLLTGVHSFMRILLRLPLLPPPLYKVVNHGTVFFTWDSYVWCMVKMLSLFENQPNIIINRYVLTSTHKNAHFWSGAIAKLNFNYNRHAILSHPADNSVSTRMSVVSVSKSSLNLINWRVTMDGHPSSTKCGGHI